MYRRKLCLKCARYSTPHIAKIKIYKMRAARPPPRADIFQGGEDNLLQLSRPLDDGGTTNHVLLLPGGRADRLPYPDHHFPGSVTIFNMLCCRRL